MKTVIDTLLNVGLVFACCGSAMMIVGGMLSLFWKGGKP